MREPSPLFSLVVDDATKRMLSHAAYWAKLFAIAGAVLLLAIVGRFVYSVAIITHVSVTSANHLVPTLMVAIPVIVIPGFAFVYAYRFAKRVKKALSTNDQMTLHQSFNSLIAFFRHCTILLLIAVVLIAATWAWHWWHLKY